MTTSSMWRLLAATFTVAVLIAGIIVTWALMRPQSEIRRDVTQESITHGISRLEFENFEASDIVVRTGNGDQIGIQRTFRWTGDDRPKHTDTWNGDTLTVAHLCGDADSDDCSIKYVVTLPAKAEGIVVVAETSAGDMEVAGVKGELRLSTVSGDLVADKPAGTLVLRTVSGDLSVRESSSSTVHANTVSGDLDLRFLAAPASVTAETTSGDLTLVVPREATGYRVEATTTSGDQRVDVDRNGSRPVKAKTVSGDLTISYR